MGEITLTLPDGSAKKYNSGVTGLEVAQSIGSRLAKSALAISVDGALRDMNREINSDANIKILTFDSEDGKNVFWHSTSHIMAQAVKRLYPNAVLTIGPATENGFYYDIAHDPFSVDDFEKIEKEMQKIVEENFETKRKLISPAQAKQIFRDNKYKIELIEEHSSQGEEITVYEQGEFVDLCRGPHIPSTGYVKAFKLTKISGAYWRGDSKNDSLQRLYGISFPDKKMLNAYINILKEAEKRDHRKIGKEAELFMFHDWSPGSPFFLPKGTIIYNQLLDFLRSEYRKRGYDEVITPQIFNKALWEKSGHWSHYKENMFLMKVDEEEFSLKPMNCPSHVLMFKSKTRSYRDLPMKYADFCYLHRNELKGVLSGLTRVRKFSQDDAHVFCTEDQIFDEINSLLEFVSYIYNKVFNFEFSAKLSTRPDDYLGDEKTWELAEKALSDCLKENSIEFEIKEKEGAFYGPKIDIDVQDAIGRSHQLATIQLDFQMPQRLEAEYEGSDGKKHHAVMIHRAILGSFERFIGLLIEHFAGRFPLWLSPEQVRVLSVSEKYEDYANRLVENYKSEGIRAEIDVRPAPISAKVRDAQVARVNYILVVGEKEEKSQTVTVRDTRRNKIEEKDMDDFRREILKEIEQKKAI